MARTAILIMFALLVLFLLPLASPTNNHGRVAATNSSSPERSVWLDTTVGILPPERPGSGERPSLPQPRPTTARVPADGPARDWEAARQALRQLGVKQFRLETWGEPVRYRFTCWVPFDGNIYITRQFQAVAETDLDAVWEVIGQIRAWMAEREKSQAR